MIHEHSTYTLPDGRSVTMVNDNVLVRPDPNERMSKGGLVLTHDEHIFNTGTILAFGTVETKKGAQYPIPDLEVGKKAVFIRYLAEQHSNHYIRDVFDGLIRIKLADIILVADTDEDCQKLFR